MKKAIYTELFGDYDSLQPAPNYAGWDSILFTDMKLPFYKGWIPVRIESKDPKKDSRKFKWLSHRYLKDYSTVCHMDSNMSLRREPPHKPLWFQHPRRKTVKEEAARIIELKKDSEGAVNRQIGFFELLGFKDDKGMYQNGYFVREHTEDQNALCEAVWEIIEQWSYRDQIALPVAIWSTGIFPKNITPSAQFKSMAYVYAHKNPIFPSVHHITPGRADKNLGRAINELIEHLPMEDWICVRDIDTVPAYHYTFFEACEEIARNAEYDLVGCMSNRLGLPWQLYKGAISDDPDFRNHIDIGKELYEEHGASVLPISDTIGGLFMLFPKTTWKKVGKFPEGKIRINGKFIDYWFSKRAMKQKMRIGVAQGIYLFHIYRMGMGNPKGNIKHLL
jgi:hypothetical protein